MMADGENNENDALQLNYSMKNKFSLKQQQQQIGKIMVERKKKFEEDENNPAINKSVWNEEKKMDKSFFSERIHKS